jgi:DNA uptake protein ComE-like DNA-binding protein
MSVQQRQRRGFAMVIVLWAVAIAALALAALQVVASRQVASGREAAARVRATWAARAGLEATIARLQSEWEQATPLGATSLVADLAVVAEGTVGRGKYLVLHESESGTRPGPADGHAKLNINYATEADLLLMPDMTEDIAAAIMDWIDEDEEVRLGGAEAETYQSLASGYRPRNGPVRTMRELELIRGVTPEMVRGEDWNQNGVLDANENDGELSWPPDNADGKLDAGWSQFWTAASVSGGLASDGQQRLDLSSASSAEVSARLSVSDEQAQTILAQIQQAQGAMEQFIATPLSQMATTLQRNGQLTFSSRNRGGGGRGGGQQFVQVPDLTREQLTALLDGGQVGPATGLSPGKVNLNTASEQTLEYLGALSPAARDAILLYRDQLSGDVRSMTELLDVPGLNAETVSSLWRIMDVRSNVFVVTVRGIDEISGLSVEMTAEIDRSADPVVIRSMVIR